MALIVLRVLIQNLSFNIIFSLVFLLFFLGICSLHKYLTSLILEHLDPSHHLMRKTPSDFARIPQKEPKRESVKLREPMVGLLSLIYSNGSHYDTEPHPSFQKAAMVKKSSPPFLFKKADVLASFCHTQF